MLDSSTIGEPQCAQRSSLGLLGVRGSDPAPCCSIAAEQFVQQYVSPPWITCVVGSTIAESQWAQRIAVVMGCSF
jgi:hypothetical protein